MSVIDRQAPEIHLLRCNDAETIDSGVAVGECAVTTSADGKTVLAPSRQLKNSGCSAGFPALICFLTCSKELTDALITVKE